MRWPVAGRRPAGAEQAEPMRRPGTTAPPGTNGAPPPGLRAGPAPPADLESLARRIGERRAALPVRLRQVADFALAHADDMAFGTAASIAAAAGVQPSTLVRFAQSLGYDGFSALQAVFRDPLRRQAGQVLPAPGASADGAAADGAAEDAAEGTAAVFATAARAVAEAALPAGRIEAAAALLARAGTIHLIARRRSFPLTSYMAYAFGRMRIRCELAGTALGIEDEILAMAGPQDAAIAISFAPYAPETLRRVAALTARGVPVVALTDGARSPLARAATLAFALPEARADDARLLPAGMAFAVALTRAVERARHAAG